MRCITYPFKFLFHPPILITYPHINYIFPFFFIIFKGFEYVDSNNGTLGPNGGASAAAASSVHPSMSMTGGIHTREMHDNQGFEDEGIAESGM